MVYQRNDVSASDEDIVLNDGGEMTVKNPSSTDRKIAVTCINLKEKEEVLLRLEDYNLTGLGDIKFVQSTMYRYDVDNLGSSQSDYTLKVRYLSENEYFEWLTVDIPIGKDHHHTIVLRPEDDDKEVRILIDTTGDGMPDDSLELENGGKLGINKGLMDLYEFTAFPNPANDFVTIHAS